MDKQQIKAAVCAAIDQNRDKLIALGKDIFAHPELGLQGDPHQRPGAAHL